MLAYVLTYLLIIGFLVKFWRHKLGGTEHLTKRETARNGHAQGARTEKKKERKKERKKRKEGKLGWHENAAMVQVAENGTKTTRCESEATLTCSGSHAHLLSYSHAHLLRLTRSLAQLLTRSLAHRP